MSRAWFASGAAFALIAMGLALVTQSWIATGTVWLVGVVASVAAVIFSRARSGAAWLGLALSAVLPLAVLYLAMHPAGGS
jgi:hypothetical protein